MKNKRDDYDDYDLPEMTFEDLDDYEDEANIDEEDEMLDELTASLGAQVSDELGIPEGEDGNSLKPRKKKRKLYTVLKVFGILIGVLIIFALWLVFTPSGRRVGTRIAAKFIHSSMDTVEVTPEVVSGTPIPTVDPEMFKIHAHRYESYVKNFLIFGIEEIGGASNTDAMILVSLNTKDDTVKLTSFMRDTYVTIPGYRRNKLNSAYSRGGADLLVNVLENTYDMEISGYASVNFSSFESIIDALGGIDLELGAEEARYLCRTNYISKKENRTVKEGWNHMNGNQVMGYCRVRKVATLGGANNDYGRTVRQRRVIKAVIEQFKSSSYLDMLSIAQEILGYLTTNITEDQIADALLVYLEHNMTTAESFRLPADDLFRDSGKAGIDGITYALVIDDYRDQNIELFHQYLFLDPTPTPTPTPTSEVTEAPAQSTPE